MLLKDLFNMFCDFEEYLDNFTNDNEDTDCKTNYKEFFNLKELNRYGGEGCGDSYWFVFSLEYENEKKYFRRNGWYASYNGYEWNDYEEVKPVETTICVYESL